MKTYIINVSNKIGVATHGKAYLSYHEAIKECHRLADDYIANLTKTKTVAKKEEQPGLKRLLVLGKDTVLCTYYVREIELELTTTNANTEILPWDEEVIFHATESPNGYFFKNFTPSCDTSICYIESSVFGCNNAISVKEDYADLKGFYCFAFIREKIASFIPGNDIDLIEQMAVYILAKAQGESIDSLIESAKDTLEEMVKMAYRNGSTAYLIPYNKDDQSCLVRIISYHDCENIRVCDYNGIDQEITLSEVYRRSEKKCPKCGQPLYFEKYGNTDFPHCPYVCMECDENFYDFEIKEE